MIRSDMSNCLVHLTLAATEAAAAEAFLSIVSSRELRGSSRDIRGGYKCVCFSEAPLAVLVHSLALPAVHGLRYAPFGVIVAKDWLFTQGGRPVVYQPEEEFDLLSEDIRYRHVRYDPTKGPDYSWEREWRIRTSALSLHLAKVTFIVPTRSWEEHFFEEHAGQQRSQAFFVGRNATFGIERSAMHFIALEDLGIHFSSVPEQ